MFDKCIFNCVFDFVLTKRRQLALIRRYRRLKRHSVQSHAKRSKQFWSQLVISVNVTRALLTAWLMPVWLVRRPLVSSMLPSTVIQLAKWDHQRTFAIVVHHVWVIAWNRNSVTGHQQSKILDDNFAIYKFKWNPAFDYPKLRTNVEWPTFHKPQLIL